ncbi:MAG: LVIVD repeat-containing protein [Candidatus Hodarchaeota archaeon]
MLMQKRRGIFFVLIIFNSLFINQISVMGLEYTSTFTEIGSIASGRDIINMRLIENDLAFLVEITRGLAIYNITNPANCYELDYHPLSFVHDIELDLERKLVYITALNGVNIFNFSNPNQLELLSVYLNYTSSTFIQLKGELLFIGAEDQGLQIVNVTDPYNPIMIDKWVDGVGHVGPVYILDNYAFVGIRIPNTSGPPTPIDLKLLDISDPKNITFISIIDTGEGYRGGAPKAHYQDLVYFNDYDNGLKILNFSDPFNITVLGIYFDGGSINDLKLINNKIAFLADDYEGLKIINCSDPKNPFKIGSYSHQWRTIRVAVKNESVYLATLGGGVRILTTGIITNEIPIYPIFIFCNLLIGSLILLYTIKKKNKKK